MMGKSLHCDVCDVDFNIPTAVLYHNNMRGKRKDLGDERCSDELPLFCVVVPKLTQQHVMSTM
ncbi:Uncharacterized protein OBRU01_09346 [Operophtera brumata]|uniref:Uncharacterized protein n=1 Tax=Operophtera brumata TaxID=104452 RepID=A0A0L7LFX3_OPEBR|nr:Uncharacterized protein OBRU01_09346 [Operophtera brumata]